MREAYYASLVTQFQALRAQLSVDPPPELVAALDKDHDIYVGNFGPKSRTFSVWSHRFRNTDPLPVQIAAMDQRNALKLLRVILRGKFIRRGHDLRERTSCWIWALLARLPDRGEMDYEDIGWVRELGKRAVLMMVSMAQMAALQEGVGDDLEGEDMEEDMEEEDNHLLCETEVDMDQVDAPDPLQEEEPTVSQSGTMGQPPANVEVDVDDQEADMDLDDGEVTDDSSDAGQLQADIAALKAQLLAKLENVASANDDFPDETKASSADAEAEGAIAAARAHANTRVTLNMILTVAGEFYGQTDLLEFRDPFPPV